jgi:uncharacterized protein YciI
MPVLVMCQDAENASELRQQHHAAHAEYIDTVLALVCVAGAMCQTPDAIENNTQEGTCFIFDTDDMAVARKLMQYDPYAQAGVYSEVAFVKFNPSAGYWITGIPGVVPSASKSNQ